MRGEVSLSDHWMFFSGCWQFAAPSSTEYCGVLRAAQPAQLWSRLTVPLAPLESSQDLAGRKSHLTERVPWLYYRWEVDRGDPLVVSRPGAHWNDGRLLTPGIGQVPTLLLC